ncbi:MAG: 50S ribosomal protein L24 [bacterium]
MLSRIKKDDKVIVLQGKDRGKEGLVIDVNSKKGKVLVKGVNVVTKHRKARKSGEKSKIVKEEKFLPLCKVMPFCTSCKKACRIQVKFMEEGKKVRVCHRCKEAF